MSDSAITAGVFACSMAISTQLLCSGLMAQRRNPAMGRSDTDVHPDDFEVDDNDDSMPTRRAPPLAHALPPLPSLPPPPSPQPDELTGQLALILRCDERIPPESIQTTNNDIHSLTTFVRATYKGVDDASRHQFAYTIEFTNTGAHEVQLLTRHLVFVDDEGLANEIKGPGAKGAMPTLAPGETWSYSSKTRLRTPRGSMHGWFTFEPLEGDGDSIPTVFPAGVGRLALSPDGRAELVPCASPAPEGSVASTSVHRTERVFVGAVVVLTAADEDVGRFSWTVDLQVNNARSASVFIVGYRCACSIPRPLDLTCSVPECPSAANSEVHINTAGEVIDAHGQRFRSEGAGVGHQDGKKLDALKLPPSSAMRIRCEMPQIHTATATIHGVLLARFVTPEEDTEDLTLPTAHTSEVVELVVAPLGASVDGSPVPEHKPLGFLDAVEQYQS